MKARLEDLLAANDVIIADGGMGTMLFAMGLSHGYCPELWNVEAPENIRRVHRGYIDAGAQIILTNSFGGTRLRLARHKLSDRAHELNKAAAELARAEADAAPNPVVVGGSMGPTGEMMAPLGRLSFDDAKAAFREQAAALIEGGVDVIWIETMSDLAEVQAAVEGAREVSADIPIVTTMTFDTHGHTMMGVSPQKALETLSGFGPLAIGGNCGNGPDEIEGVIEEMRRVDSTVPLVAKANAGIPRLVDGRTVHDATPEDMARYAVTVHRLGARIIGACCGSTPDHIRAIAGALRAS
jgi:5-methyltetrahydrofolate--homocysteine methyltransferase